MKASTNKTGKVCVLTLEPENQNERDLLKDLIEAFEGRTFSISHRGYKYMTPAVEFYIQPQGSRD